MADDKPITPAPKPSQRGKAVAKRDADVKEGVVTFTEEQLRKDTAKRQELIAAKEGTPGKDLAVLVQREIDRDKAAAPIIAAAVKDAKAWDDLHGKAAKVTKSLADKLAKLRSLYDDKDGNPDMRGTSQAYRDAATSIYDKAGFDTGKAAHVQGAVRYHLSDSVRTMLRTDERFANGDEKKYLELCERYRLNPDSAAVRQKEGRKAVAGGTRLPALSLPEDNPGALYYGAAQYAHKALEFTGDVDPSAMDDGERETLRDELTAVRDRAEEMLGKLGDV